MFSDFGEIESVFIPKDEETKEPKEYGYVCFKNSEDAEKALENMNKTKMDDGNLLLVNRHVSKRENELVTGGGGDTKIGPIS
jgi:RNA recognition motif-containing protein